MVSFPFLTVKVKKYLKWKGSGVETYCYNYFVIVYILLFFDLAIFILSYNCNLKTSSNELVYIIFEAALLLIAKSKQSILRCK